MSSYYQPQSVVMNKQISQMTTTASMEDKTNILARENSNEFSNKQIKNTPNLVKLNSLNPSFVKDNSNSIGLEACTNKNPFEKNAIRKLSISENRGSFPDYQPRNFRISQEGNQKIQDAIPGVSKIGEKIKNKTQFSFEKSLNRLSSNGTQNIPQLTPIKSFESSYQLQKSENTKLEEVVNLLKIQIAKIDQKVRKNQLKLDKLENKCKRIEQNSISAESSMSPQFEQMNKILSLVQQAKNRDDYRKSMRMIEQLRQNILDLHSQVANFKCSKQQTSKQVKQIYQLRNQISSDELRELKMYIAGENNQLSKKIQAVDDKYRLIIREYEDKGSSWTTGTKKFGGKMITLFYQEKISSLHNQEKAEGSSLGKDFKVGIQTDPSYKQNNLTVIITSKAYYLDPEGYLLDKQKYYLLNKQNKQIKLSDKEIELLKNHNLI